jgi:hypothetical protein
MSNTPLSKATLKAMRKAIKGHKEEIILRSGCTRQTVDNALNGYYIRFGNRIPYNNEKVIGIAIEILEREQKKKEALEKKVKSIT